MKAETQLREQIEKLCRLSLGEREALTVRLSSSQEALSIQLRQLLPSGYDMVDAISVTPDGLTVTDLTVQPEAGATHKDLPLLVNVTQTLSVTSRSIPGMYTGIFFSLTLDSFEEIESHPIYVVALKGQEHTSVEWVGEKNVAPQGLTRMHDASMSLPYTMRYRNDMAAAVAAYLEAHPAVREVHYPGLKNFKQHEIARANLSHGFGPLLTFSLTENKAAPFFSLLKVVKQGRGPNGSSYTHVWRVEDKRGKVDGAVLVAARLGLEDIDTIVTDFEQALKG